jgi:uncharacterized membrane protein
VRQSVLLGFALLLLLLLMMMMRVRIMLDLPKVSEVMTLLQCCRCCLRRDRLPPLFGLVLLGGDTGAVFVAFLIIIMVSILAILILLLALKDANRDSNQDKKTRHSCANCYRDGQSLTHRSGTTLICV